MNDLVANYLTCIRNAIRTNQKTVVGIPCSTLIEGISRVLKEEGYLDDFRVTEIGSKRTIAVDIRCYKGRPVISHLERVSKPGRRVYVSAADIPYVRTGLGIAVLSTSHGILSDKKAREIKAGGEVLCKVW